MAKIPVHFAVSSLSCAPASILKPQDILIPAFATQKMISRIIAFQAALSHVVPIEEFSISFHDGYMFDTNVAIHEFATNNILVSSFDTPDVRSILAFIQKLAENIFQMSPYRLLENIGWQLASVTKISNYTSKVRTGIQALSHDRSPKFVRTFAGSWKDSPIGELLISLLKEARQENPSLALAIEIDSRNQTPNDFFTFIKALQEKHPDLPIYIDLDVGHMAESLKYHHTFSQETLIELINEVLHDTEKSALIGLLSLNQYDHHAEKIHIDLMEGSIDYREVMREFGEASRRGAFSVVPTVLAEFSPMAYHSMISPDGINYFKSLFDAFDGNENSLHR